MYINRWFGINVSIFYTANGGGSKVNLPILITQLELWYTLLRLIRFTIFFYLLFGFCLTFESHTKRALYVFSMNVLNFLAVFVWPLVSLIPKYTISLSLSKLHLHKKFAPKLEGQHILLKYQRDVMVFMCKNLTLNKI